MGCFDIFCTLCGGPLNTGQIWDSKRSPDPEPGGMYWDYNQNLLCEEDLEVSSSVLCDDGCEEGCDRVWGTGLECCAVVSRFVVREKGRETWPGLCKALRGGQRVLVLLDWLM